jgi:4-hydroxy-tetrahydrodipicolinate synthase
MFHGSIVALVTPFRNGAVDERAYADLIEWHLAEGTHGFVPSGTTGESPTLSHAEHDGSSSCVSRPRRRRPVIAGAGSNSTDEAVSLARHASGPEPIRRARGAPYYNRPTQEGPLRPLQGDPRRRRPARSSSTTSRPLARSTSASRRWPDCAAANIVGVKDATADIVRPLLTHAACGAEFPPALGRGRQHRGVPGARRHGCISVTANVAPRLCASLHAAWAAGRLDEALAFQRRLLPLHKALFCETSPAPAKHALSRLGLCAPTCGCRWWG